jgi:hypothetical protein
LEDSSSTNQNLKFINQPYNKINQVSIIKVYNMTEHNFKVLFIFKIGKTNEEKWGTATVVGGTLKDAIKDVKDGYKRLGQKVLEVVPS